VSTTHPGSIGRIEEAGLSGIAEASPTSSVGPITACRAHPAIAFPGEPVSFDAQLTPGGAGDQVRWSGGGVPASGQGRHFRTRWASGGTYAVTATCDTSRVTLAIQVCPVDQLLRRAASFYGASIDMSRVMVKSSSAIVDGRPWTNGNTIRFPKPTAAATCPDLETMVHELAHVWEHQNGDTQIVSGAVEQLGRLVVPGYNPYDFGGPAGVHGAEALRGFSKESQAQIIENYWRTRMGFTADTGGALFTAAYVADLRRLVRGAGIGTTAPSGATSTVGGVVDSIIGGIVNGILHLFRL
jgi:hypothetical protein